MFRDMRRFRQLLPEEETLRIMKSGKTGFLGVLGDEGYPYVVPVNYVYDDGKIYFHGAKQGHKFDSIRNCDKVSFCVVDADDIVPEELTTYFRSAMLFGRCSIVSDPDEVMSALTKFGMKYYPDADAVKEGIQKELSATCTFRIDIEHLTGKEAIELVRAKENRW